MKTIYLIRHGEIATGQHRYVGSLDIGLTDRGRAQIADLAVALAKVKISRVYTSPLSRCQESAAILCRTLGGSAESITELREISLGAWEGLTQAEIEHQFPGAYVARGQNLAGFRPPGGESFADLLNRAWPAFERIMATADQALAIVGHAGLNRVLLARILDLPLANIFRLGQDHGCLNLLQQDREGLRVKTLNWRPISEGDDKGGKEGFL